MAKNPFFPDDLAKYPRISATSPTWLDDRSTVNFLSGKSGSFHPPFICALYPWNNTHLISCHTLIQMNSFSMLPIGTGSHTAGRFSTWQRLRLKLTEEAKPSSATLAMRGCKPREMFKPREHCMHTRRTRGDIPCGSKFGPGSMMSSVRTNVSTQFALRYLLGSL